MPVKADMCLRFRVDALLTTPPPLMATPTGQLTFEPASLTPYLTVGGEGNTSPDPQQLSEELPEGGEGCHGDAHHPPQPLGGALDEVDGVSGEADACRRQQETM